MADCCNEIRAELAALRAEIAKIKPVDEKRIIQQSIAGAEALIIPAVITLIVQRLAPISAAIAAIEAKLAAVGAQAAAAAGTAGSALSTAGAALAKVAGLASAIAALAASVATLLVLGGRIDALEAYVDSLASDLSKVYGLIGGIRATANQALVKANQALNKSAIPGPRGIQGVRGLQGARGIQGVQGKQGLQGEQGLQGVAGATGARGATGATGARGLQGATGATGARGLQGVAGATGARGLQGVAGATGATGARGLQGVAGATGATGARGLQGVAGERGLDGKDGKEGELSPEALAKLNTINAKLDIVMPQTALISSIRPLDFATTVSAAAAGTCQSAQPGGCTSNAMRRELDPISNQLSNGFDKIFNAFSAGANAAQMALLSTINLKLGAQIAGGLSAKLVNGFQWLQLDRALSVLTFAATVQNHLMLSRDIGTTLLGAFSNVLSLIGLKNDDGQAYDLGSVINSSIENLIKGIVGAENYAQLSETWAKANRIYQATTNVLNSFQQLSSTILSGMELIAGNNSKIGNALKKAGMVLETAYGWMNPQPKFNRVTQALEKLQAGASTIQMVTQAPLDIINATTELQNANTELIKAFKEDHKPENKAPEIPEPDELKRKQIESKTVSQPPVFDFSDLFDGED